MATKISNGRKMHQTAVKYTNIFLSTPYQIYLNWDFWLENIPSGNHDVFSRKAAKGESLSQQFHQCKITITKHFFVSEMKKRSKRGNSCLFSEFFQSLALRSFMACTMYAIEKDKCYILGRAQS
jgi:hypothetical protein